MTSPETLHRINEKECDLKLMGFGMFVVGSHRIRIPDFPHYAPELFGSINAR